MSPTALHLQYSSSTEEGVLHSFQDINELLDTLMMQQSVFKAISLSTEINRLNGYRLITDYHIRQIKDYYKQQQTKQIKERLKEDKNRQLQKGYMQLLSEWTEIHTK